MNNMTTFTDDDLKRLKAKEGYWKTTIKMNKGQSETWGFVDGNKIEALIDRLEAAEETIHSHNLNGKIDVLDYAYAKWCKAAGK